MVGVRAVNMLQGVQGVIVLAAVRGFEVAGCRAGGGAALGKELLLIELLLLLLLLLDLLVLV